MKLQRLIGTDTMAENSSIFNPYLEGSLRPRNGAAPGKGSIDIPGKVPNLPSQTRSHPPTEFENQLGDALEKVFTAGAVELDDVVAKLNEIGFRTENGTPWTAELFTATMQRLPI
jgi:hypothetical protein